jgi:hypothetical protein
MGRSTPPISTNAGGSFTGGVARKIRHHGGKPVQYTGGNMPYAGVPMRLSATEVEDEQPNMNNRASKQEEDLSEWERDPAWGYAGQRTTQQHHHRTASGRSSLGSQRRGTGIAYGQRYSTASSTPTSGHSRSPSETHLQDLAEETPMPHPRKNTVDSDYFAPSGGQGGSGGSGSSASDRENSFGAAGALPPKTEKESKDPDDLIRRGSVDERTMTMGRGVRLFVANPDLSD